MTPFLKWAGGKRWLFDKHFIASLPPHRRYIEPFLGGGAGFFALKPGVALLSDINGELISLYQVIRDDHAELGAALTRHQTLHSTEYYYAVRESEPSSQLDRAARMLYLNRTCWNGLYRLNKLGKFNVPIGTKDAVVLATDDFARTSELLAHADLITCDFEDTIAKASEGDLVFVDPPYTVKHNNNGFVKYNEHIFSWADQERLKNAVVAATQRGASVVVTNANHASIVDLYSGVGLSSIVDRSSVISGKPAGRSAVTEFLVRL